MVDGGKTNRRRAAGVPVDAPFGELDDVFVAVR
jgi:hypothetical protein